MFPPPTTTTTSWITLWPVGLRPQVKTCRKAFKTMFFTAGITSNTVFSLLLCRRELCNSFNLLLVSLSHPLFLIIFMFLCQIAGLPGCVRLDLPGYGRARVHQEGVQAGVGLAGSKKWNVSLTHFSHKTGKRLLKGCIVMDVVFPFCPSHRDIRPLHIEGLKAPWEGKKSSKNTSPTLFCFSPFSRGHLSRPLWPLNKDEKRFFMALPVHQPKKSACNNAWSIIAFVWEKKGKLTILVFCDVQSLISQFLKKGFSKNACFLS